MQDGTGCSSPIQLATPLPNDVSEEMQRGIAPPRPHAILLHTMHNAEAVNEIVPVFFSRSCFFLTMLVCCRCCRSVAALSLFLRGSFSGFLHIEIVARETCTGATFLAESGQPRSNKQSWCRNTASPSAMLCGLHLAMRDTLRFFFSVLTCKTVTSFFFLIQP